MKKCIARCGLYILMINLVSVSADFTVTWSISSSHKYDSQSFAVQGSYLIVTCEHQGLSTANINTLKIYRLWKHNRNEIYAFINPSTSAVQGNMVGRATATYTTTSVSVNITQFNASEDALQYECEVCDASLLCKYNRTLNLASFVLVPPTGTNITITSPSSWVEENVDIIVICRAAFTNRPRVSTLHFTLKVNGIDTNGTGIITPASGNVNNVTYTQSVRFTRNDTKLQCVLTLQKDKPAELNLTIHYKPTNVSISGSKYPGPIGENTKVTVTCEAVGKPTPNITLYNGSSVISSGEGPVFQHIITLTKEDNGRNLSCNASEVTLKYNQLVGNIKYNVSFGATKVAMIKPNGLIPEDADATISCLTDESNPPANIVWSKNNDGIAVSTIINRNVKSGSLYNGVKRQSNLSVTVKRDDNHAVYQCYTKDKPTVKVHYNLTVKFPPNTSELILSPRNGVKTGDTVNVTCKLGSSYNEPATSIKWLKRNSTMTGKNSSVPAEFGGINITSVITFKVDKLDNGAEVTCIPLWDGKEQTLIREVKLNVFFPHNVEVHKSSSNVKESESLTLTCNATGGNPSSVDSYNWSVKYRYGSGVSMKHNSTSEEITISTVMYTHAGIYTCAVNNTGGLSEGTTELMVKYSPRDIGHANEAVAFSSLNNSINLTCTVLSYPKIEKQNVSVKFNGTEVGYNIYIVQLPSIDKYLIKMSINSVKRGDYGNYTFLFNDGAGSIAFGTRELREREGKMNDEEVKQVGNVIIIGAVSGVVAASLVLVIVIIAVILIRRKKQTKDTPKPDSPVYTDVIVDTRTEDTASINSHVTDSRPQDIDRDDGDVPAQPYRNVGNYQNDVLQRDGDEMVGNVDEPHSPTGNNVSKSNWIETGDFGRHFAYMSSHDAFEAEYTTLPEGQTSSWVESDIPELKAKNRFKNILPYDHNRVHLQEVQDTPLSDYINASYIQGYSKQVTYIAASGVTVDAIPDFWRMVWEQNISVIVMVTNLKEKGKTKCERYWPREGDATYGDIDVALVHRSTYADYELKKFKLIQGGQQKKVSHYHYTGWPDHGVPQNAAGIFKIREAVKQQRAYGKTPVLVHCSAGIGRTGTFIALDILLDQAESEGGVDVYMCVEALRYQRMFMVQTVEQYSFIYHSMYEALVIGSASVACADFAKYFFTATADGMLEKQYQLLEATKPEFKKEEMEFAFGFGNDRKNRDKQIVPNDHFRVKPSSMPDEYINAVYVDGYKSKNSFIATQVPFDFTAKTFWRMIFDEKYSTIVCLQDDPLDNVWFPMDTETLQTDVFVIEQSGKKSIGDVDIYDLTVGRQGATDYANLSAVGEERHMVKLYHVNNWADKELSSRNISTLRKLYAEIQQWHIQLHTTEPCVAAICMNGARECGLFIGASCLFDMANAEQEVDVFHMVKQIRVNRPQFINSLEQYKHLHEVVQEYISQFGEYANFS